MSAPIEVKVSAATVGAVLSSLGVWALQTYVFRGDLPLPVMAAVQTLVPGVVAFAAGWLSPHTPRPDLQVDPVDVAAADDEPTRPDTSDVDTAEHALDGSPGEIPATTFTTPPRATRYDGPGPATTGSAIPERDGH